MTMQSELTADTINRARALIPRGTNYYRLARELGFKKQYKKAKGMTEQLERLTTSSHTSSPVEMMLDTVQSAFHALWTRQGIHYKSDEAVQALGDDLHRLLTSRARKEIYQKMDDTIARWRGAKERIEDGYDGRIPGRISRSTG